MRDEGRGARGAVERSAATGFGLALAVSVACCAAAEPVGAAPDDRPPFRFRYELPCDGLAALVLEDGQGRRLRNVSAQLERRAGPSEEAWDLKDAAGAYVAPGTYRLRGIVGPPVELHYGVTPYPNVDQLWPDRTPWLQGHSGAHGWLSDHSCNWAVAARADRIYFGASMAEAGVCLIECEPSGRKLWGKHDLGAWLGVYMMAASPQAVYIAATDDSIYRLDPATHELRKLGRRGGRPDRGGMLCSFAGNDEHVFLAFTGSSLLDGAAGAGAVDLKECAPKPAGDDYLRALRLKGHPPGQNGKPGEKRPQGNGVLDLETTLGSGPRQYWVAAFKEPVPLGSVVLPVPAGKDVKVSFSVLKPEAPYPPRVREESDWLAFGRPEAAGWTCLAAPPATRTRALRVVFARSDRDEFDAMNDADPGAKPKEGPSLDDDALVPSLRKDAPEPDAARSAEDQWLGKFEGLKLLRRRFQDVTPAARIRVNSGTLAPDGSWDAQRTAAIGRESPGVYLLEWDKAQTLHALAIKEIDGAVTEIDVWQGPAPAELPLEGAALDRKSREGGWRNVATYRQRRRSAYYPSADLNRFARYLDGYVDLGEEVTTRAVRLRVVEPWFDNGDKNAECRKHDGRSEHGLHHTESYAAKLDTRICRVEGVAALQYIGGEAPVDELASRRLEVWDARTGALVRELPVEVGWHGMTCGPKGELYAIDRPHQNVVRVDATTGKTTVVVPDCAPDHIAVGPDGAIYVHPWTHDGTDPIQAFDAQGPSTGSGQARPLRTIGKAGGHAPGRWDPEQFGRVGGLAADAAGSLWVLETQDYPRRIVQYKTDGTLVKEILGNTFYGGGGGGAVNRFDRSCAWYGPVEFEVDWSKGTSRVRAFLGPDVGGDFVALRPTGRKETYLASAPHSLGARQGHGKVWIYDSATRTTRLVAAMGDAEDFGPLRSSAVVSLLQGDVPKGYTFAWSDLNGNGEVNPEEVRFVAKPKRNWSYGVGRFDTELGCTGPGVRYAVKEYLAGGVPVYAATPMTGAAHLRLDSGNLLTLGGQRADGAPSENFVTTPSGELVWAYPAGNFGSGLHVPPWQPGVVGYQFSIIGHETAPAGELGEFFVVHANTGEWNLWTADGLLAGQILLHKGNPKAKLFGPPEVRPGLRLDPLSASQEHFHGFFTRTEPDNRYCIVAGFTHMSLLEVKGLEKFRRFASEVKVTAADLAAARAWDAARVRRHVETRALTVTAPRVKEPPALDGDRAPHEWGTATPVDDAGTATLSAAFDTKNLYLCWTGKELGAVRNSGTEFQRLFKTGAALDFLLGTDPGADPKRERPARGDLRLLVTFVNEKPVAVLYQPVAPGAAAGEKWSTRTAAGGETAFDRVVRLPRAQAAQRVSGDDFSVELAVPLADLGLQPKPGVLYRMDWGVLASGDGNQVKQRLYWANQTATGTSDEAIEARLEPGLWGYLRFGSPDDLESELGIEGATPAEELGVE